MPGEEGRKVSSNQKGKKGKGSGGATNPLLAVMAHVPKASSVANMKGASRTRASDMKGASHTQSSDMKGASCTQLSILKKDAKGVEHTQKSGPMKDAKDTSANQGGRNKASKEGTSHTQVRDESKVAQPKEADDRTGSAERALMEEQSMSQEAKEQLAKTPTQLARELSDSGGPLLSDTIDANHLACYLALEAEKNYLAPNMFSGDCEFTVMETWQQCGISPPKWRR